MNIIRTIPQKLGTLFGTAVRVYMNPLAERDLIRTDNSSKFGIYCWVNLLNGKIYVGRATGVHKQLYGRLQDYFQPAYLNHPRNATSLICRALLKYGMECFALLILEYVDTEAEAISREEYYLNNTDCEYNIQKSAGHSLGFGRGVPRSAEYKQHARDSQWADKHLVDGPYDCPETDNLLEQQRNGVVKTKYRTMITITDALYPEVTATFYSWGAAAAAINIKHSSLIKYVNNKVQRPYNGRYHIAVMKFGETNAE